MFPRVDESERLASEQSMAATATASPMLQEMESTQAESPQDSAKQGAIITAIALGGALAVALIGFQTYPRRRTRTTPAEVPRATNVELAQLSTTRNSAERIPGPVLPAYQGGPDRDAKKRRLHQQLTSCGNNFVLLKYEFLGSGQRCEGGVSQ